MSTLTLRLAAEEKQLIAGYAKTFGMSTSEFVRRAALERIEDELDLRVWDDAKAEFDSEPSTITVEEIAAEYL